MLKLATFLLSLFLGISQVWGQSGGRRSFEFVNIPSNALLMGVGGVNVSLVEADVNLMYSNPALVGDSLAGDLSFSYMGYFADVSMGTISYAGQVGSSGVWHVGVQHLNLGSIDGYDEAGNFMDVFGSGETALTIGKSHQAGNFRMGANVKFLQSNLAGFRASALVLDLGGAFVHPEKDIVVGIAMKNMGVRLTDYSDDTQSRLPFDLQAGLSFKPEYMPVRFSFTAYNLVRGDLSYFDPNSTISPGESPSGAFDRVFRHVAIGTQWLLGPKVQARIGYNHLVRRDLRVLNAGGMSGISLGMSLRTRVFEFAYTRGGYHVAGGSDTITITGNMHAMGRKKNVIH
jgi:hypothetical protein